MFSAENRFMVRIQRIQNRESPSPVGSRFRIREFFRIQFVDCNDRVAGLLIAIIGLLTSLWTGCILVVTCLQDFKSNTLVEFYIGKTIIHTSQISYFTIAMTCTAGLLYGIKLKNKSYLMPWIFTKILELIVMLMGIILLSIGNQKYLGVIPFGICFLIIGFYITLCVWDTYKNTSDVEIPEMSEVRISTPSLCDMPPSYDETCIPHF